MMNPLLQVLEAEGCAVSNALQETMMSNESFYVKMLKKLEKNQSLQLLEEAFAKKDVNACFAASHDLKGMYATLGLTPLLEACKPIVETARQGGMDGFEEAIPALKSLHTRFLDIIAQN